jgi:hypothetical protein
MILNKKPCLNGFFILFTINGNIFVTDKSKHGPFLISALISRFPSTEHSWNVLGGQGRANLYVCLFLGARVGTVYGAKRVIEC